MPASYADFFKEKYFRGELWLPYCPNCQKAFFYPREQCPHCMEAGWEWKPASGRGRIYSYTIVNVSTLDEFRDSTPYVYALIDLEEGVRLAGNVIDCPAEFLKPDMPVKLVLVERDGRQLTAFIPVHHT